MVTASCQLRQFFAQHYIPHRIEDPRSRNLEGYRRAVDLWEQITGDPPLAEISPVTLSDFKAGLLAWTWHGAPLAASTVRKHIEHVLWILKQAGPRGPRELATAAQLIDWYPAIKLPKAPENWRRAASVASMQALYAAARQARLPRLPDVSPGAMWEALIATICSTSVRIGQLCAAPMSALRLDLGLLILPAGVCKKSKREEPKPLNARAIAHLMAIRGQREKLFPLLDVHSKTTIYKELHRLQRLAGVEPFGFHAMRRRVITELSAIDPAAAQMAAGHSLYRTTQIYQDLDLLGRAVDGFDLLAEAQ